MINADKSDLYDVLAYVAFALPPVTREERATLSRARALPQYDPKLQAFLDFVLSKYVEDGVGELDTTKLQRLLILKYHTLTDAAAEFGGVEPIRDAFVDFQQYLYRPDIADGYRSSRQQDNTGSDWMSFGQRLRWSVRIVVPSIMLAWGIYELVAIWQAGWIWGGYLSAIAMFVGLLGLGWLYEDLSELLGKKPQEKSEAQ